VFLKETHGRKQKENQSPIYRFTLCNEGYSNNTDLNVVIWESKADFHSLYLSHSGSGPMYYSCVYMPNPEYWLFNLLRYTV